MSVKVKLLALAAGAALPCLFAVAAQSADETFAVSKIINVPGAALKSFDIGFVDPVLSKYYLADRSNKSIDVVNPSDNSITQLTPGFVGDTGNGDTSGPNGVITVDHRTIWAGDGDSTVVVTDLAGTLVTPKISTGGTARADELCVDPQHGVVLVANDADDPPFITFISTSSYAILGKIKMDGTNGTPRATDGIEQCQWSPRTHKFYLNIPEVNGDGHNTQPGAVLEINPASLKIEKTFTIDHSVCAGPQGMAIGPDRQILLGCSNSGPGSIIINELTGATIHALNGESGSDEVWFNPGDDQYFLANGNHKTGTANTPELGIVDPTGNPDGTPPSTTGAPSALGSHSVAADSVTGQVYVPVNNRSTQGQLSHICSTHNAVGTNPPAPGDDTKGCIAIFTAVGQDDRGLCVADDDGAGHSGDRSDPVFIRSVCPPARDSD